LEEVVFGKVLVWVVWVKLFQVREASLGGNSVTYSPEVVDKDVEDAENQDQENSGELGFETNDNHDASNKAKQANEYSPNVPFTGKDEANEEEDE
jgi:hypothetical protein